MRKFKKDTVVKRDWSLERFAIAVKTWAHKRGVRLRLSGMREAYEAKLAVWAAVRALARETGNVGLGEPRL